MHKSDHEDRCPSNKYLVKAQNLDEEEAERVLSRMRGKLRRWHDRDHRHNVEAIAIQLELEDEQLEEWRENMNIIREKSKV